MSGGKIMQKQRENSPKCLLWQEKRLRIERAAQGLATPHGSNRISTCTRGARVADAANIPLRRDSATDFADGDLPGGAA